MSIVHQHNLQIRSLKINKINLYLDTLILWETSLLRFGLLHMAAQNSSTNKTQK